MRRWIAGQFGTLRGKLLVSMLLGVIVFAGLLAYGDFRHVAGGLEEFRWELMPLILLVTCGNYALRFVKWEFYLRRIGVKGLSRRDSFLIYFSGLGMTVTPGKVGEWLKSYLLREVHGTPITRSAPIVIAERITDSLGLLIIAGAGLVVFGRGAWPVAAIIVGVSATAIAVSRHRPAAEALLRLAARLPVIRRFAPHLEELYESTYVLVSPAAVVLMTLLSVGSWSFEVLAFHLTLVGLGVDNSWETLLKSAFILPIATLAGAIAFTPGGLGVAEAGLTSLSQRLLDMTKSDATIATLIIRVATLWFGVAVGLAAFAALTRALSRQGKTLDAIAAAPSGEDRHPVAGSPPGSGEEAGV
jgi:uncharacterized protein (TIRG00374 family)